VYQCIITLWLYSKTTYSRKILLEIYNTRYVYCI